MNGFKNMKTLLFEVALDANSGVSVYIHTGVLWVSIVGLVLLIVWILSRRQSSPLWSFAALEMDEMSLGIGESRAVLRVNREDLQTAYKIWVELSTRKIGMRVDLEHDVILQVYDSWYSFFQVTRELIKEIPVQKFLVRRSEHNLVQVAIDVLNLGVRPHLTVWQAKYRYWHDTARDLPEYAGLTPQQLQRRYPEFDQLSEDLSRVNDRLIHYRQFLKRYFS